MKYIDKNTLVVKIEKCYNECLKRAKITDSYYWNVKADSYRNVLEIINDTLEVKEVDLDEIANHEDIKNAFKAGYELGLKTQKG